MAAPAGNTNARKGDLPRRMWAGRFPENVIEAIKLNSKRLGMSQADYVIGLVREEIMSGKKDKIWCDLCQDWISRNEIKIWDNGGVTHYLCPGCDSDLLPTYFMDAEADKDIAKYRAEAE